MERTERGQEIINNPFGRLRITAGDLNFLLGSVEPEIFSGALVLCVLSLISLG
jgi:hypothetical protein